MTEAVIAAVSYLTEAEVVLTAAEAASFLSTVAEIALIVGSVYVQRQQARRAQEDQRNQYNASLRDRYVMTRGAVEVRQLVLGRQRVSGPVFFIQSYGTNREHLVFAVALAAHEIDAVEAIYFDDELVTLDGSGNVLGVNRREQFTITTTGATFNLQGTPKGGSVSAVVRYGTTLVTLGVSVTGLAVTVSGATAGQTGTVTITYQPSPSPYVPQVLALDSQNFSLDGSGSATVTLAHTPVTVSTNWVVVVLTSDPDGGDYSISAFATIVGNVLTVTGATNFVGAVFSGAACTVRYEYDAGTSRARVRKVLGAPGQAADAGMVAALPGVWTSAHTATGVAYLVVELDYDPDAFPGGLPNVSALVRGAKVYDPRTGSTAWSENPALLMRHAALSPLCGRLAASTVDDASVAVAANVCDVSTPYVVGTQTFTRPRYTAGTVVRSGTKGQDVLNDLAQAMGGKWAFIEGAMRLQAGAYVTPLQTLDETWLSDSAAVQVQPRPNRADVVNVITGKFADETSDYQVLDMPRVASSAYIIEDGAELPQDVSLNAVTFSAQAQQIAAQQMRYARQGLRVTLACNHRADPVEWGDTLLVTLPRFGWLAKPMEVLDTSYTIDGGIALTLKETDPSIWALGTSFSAVDPAPNTFLPSPFKVPPVLGLAVDSSDAVQTQSPDGTVRQRMRVLWSAITDPGVLSSSGGVEVRFGVASVPESQWQSVLAEAPSTQVDIPGVQQGQVYLVKARAYNPLVSGAWCNVVAHTVGTRSNPAAADAAAALIAASAANTALANIASDSILSPSEKPSVVQDYAVITAEQAGIDAQATAFGIATEKTAYDSAVTALTSYLGSLTGWNTVPGTDVAIVGTTFRGNFAAVYTARQTLLNKIAAEAALRASWSNITGVSVTTGQIAPNAATLTMAPFYSTMNGTPLFGFTSSSNLLIVDSVAVTPAVDCVVEVVCNYEALGPASWDAPRYAAVFADETANISSGTALGATAQIDGFQKLTTVRTPFVTRGSFTLVAGTAYTIGLGSHQGIFGGGSHQFWSLVIYVTQIRR